MIRLLAVTLLILLLTSCDFLLADFSKPYTPPPGHLDISTGAATAVILDWDSMGSYCSVIKVGAMAHEYKYLLGESVEWKVDAGPITATSRCRVGSVQKNLYSNFNFEAEPGHTYRVEMRNRECTRLVNVTSDEHLVACELATERK